MSKTTSIIFLLLSFLCIQLYGQTFKHPYSFYGIGIPENSDIPRNTGMAGLSLTGNNEFSCSPRNPASYSYLSYTNFAISFRGKIFNLRQDSLSSWSNLFSFGHFGLGFPLIKKIKWNASFGLEPLSRIGYKSVFSIAGGFDTLDLTEKSELTGGFSRAYLGSSVKLFKNVYAGINLNYIFGNMHLYHSLLFDDEITLLGIISDKNSFYNHIGFDFGLSGKFKINENFNLMAGATYSPAANLKITHDETVTNFLNEDSKLTFKDTVYSLLNQFGGNLTIPLKYGIGISTAYKNKLLVGIDYKFEQWSLFEFSGVSQHLSDQHEFSLGCEFTPNIEDISYFKRVNYRAGIKYALSYLNVPVNLNHMPLTYENLRNVGLTLGAGFPVRKTNSFIDVAVEVGKTGRLYEDIIREYYFLFNVGFRFNDNWFLKTKYE